MSAMTRLVAKPLTQVAFAPYGDVIQVHNDNERKAINYGLTERHHALARVQLSDASDEAVINIFCSQPVAMPFCAKVMERHPKGSQAFFPLGEHPYLVAVAPAGDFDQSRVELFLAQANQGVNYHRGTWHHYSLTLNAPGQFLVVDRYGAGENCEEVSLQPAVEFVLEDAE